MYIIGLIFYLGLPVLAYVMESAREFILQSFALSPEITLLIGIAYIYPLSVFALSVILSKKDFANINYFRSQVTLASTLAVSFGLIGTFIGLAQMIAGIAAGMGAEGDFATKMASLLGAISLALDSMSLAFLTSILGVGASVAILFSANFLSSFYESDEHVLNTGGTNGSGGAGGEIQLNEGFQGVQTAVKQTLELVSDKETMWADLFLLLEKNTGSVVVDQLNDTLNKNNVIAAKTADEIQQLRQSQHENLVKFQESSTHFAQSIAQEIHSVSTAVIEMSDAIKLLRQDVTLSVSESNKIIDKSTLLLDNTATILNDIRLSVALPIEESLQKAISNDDFNLLFQPVKNGQGALCGAEAFIKWVDPIRGDVSNFDLFNLAREHKLLIPLDQWVMKTAIKQVSLWINEQFWNPEWELSINVTSEHLLAPGFVSHLEDLLLEFNVSPETIALEVTENIIMEHPEECRDKFRQISSLGVNVYIDNFGTGYSSLLNLKTLKIDMLKIDRKIVQGILVEGKDAQSVIRSIMLMAKELNIQVAAEGIETQEHLDMLVSEGCTSFQGYFLGRPVSDQDFKLAHRESSAANTVS